MRMESQLERKYHEKFKYVEDSLDGHGDSAFAFVSMWPIPSGKN